MSETIKISIVVPIYKVENYLRPCIESLIEQSYRDLEIILVDDGSPDNCPEICDEYAKKDMRIRVIHKRNGGVTSARKAGIAAATGDYVLCVDGDDWIEKDHVKALVKEGIMLSHADMICLAEYTRDAEGKSMHCSIDIPMKLFKDEEIKNDFFPLLSEEDVAFNGRIPWPLWLWAVRRELLLKNQMLIDDRIVYGEDCLCVCLCLLDAKSVMTIQQGGYHYVQRASSAVHQRRTAANSSKDLIRLWYRVLKDQLEQKHSSEKVRKICHQITINLTILYDYELLLEKFPNHLFLFPDVRRGTRIVVYGAGRMGYRLVRHLDRTKMCSVVLWVDRNKDLSAMPGYSICSRDAIFSADYDFIVLAMMNAASAEEVKRSLIQEGIPEEKIAAMDASDISEKTMHLVYE